MTRLVSPQKVSVYYRDVLVGELAETPEHLVVFSYSPRWLQEGFSISPFHLPLSSQLFIPTPTYYGYFDGLYGVFSDSLPDSFGRLLVDRYLASHDVDPRKVSPLLRLCLLPKAGIGGLTYRPSLAEEQEALAIDYDALSTEYGALLNGEAPTDIETLYRLGGSSGGARPKAHILYEGHPAIIKFPWSYDRKDIAEAEYAFNAAAKEAGLEVPPFHLAKGQSGASYFVSERFERDEEGQPLHYLSFSGLLDYPHELPTLDYRQLLQAVLLVTGSYDDMEQAFRLACFNVFSKNYDDHSKNFGFLYSPKLKRYVFAPAFDLTPHDPHEAEHAMLCEGKGLPEESDLLALAKHGNLPLPQAKAIIATVKKVVNSRLNAYL